MSAWRPILLLPLAALLLRCAFAISLDINDVGRRRQPPQRQIWSHKMQEGVVSSPVLSPDGATLYVGTNGKRFLALRTSDGEQVWSVPAEGWVYCSPRLTRDGSVVYYGSDDGSMRAVNTSDGSVLWRYKTEAEMTSRPALSPDETVLYAGSHDKMLRAWWAVDGRLKWALLTGDQVTSGPAVSRDGSLVFVGSFDRRLYAVNAADGSVAWTFETGGEIWSSPVLDPAGDRVVVGSNDRSLYCLEASTGRMLWNFTTRGMLEAPALLLQNGSVAVVGSDDFHLYAVNASTGQQIWRFMAGDAVACGPSASVDEGVVYVGCNSGMLFAVNATTGEEQWRFKTGGPIFGTPAVAKDDSAVMAGSWDGHVYSMRTGGLKAGWDVDPATVGLVISGIVLGAWLLLWYYLKAKHLDSYLDAPVPVERHSLRNMVSLRAAARASTRSLRHAVTHTLPFWVAGATLGLAFGAATMWVQVLIRSKMPWVDGTDYPRDFFGSVPFYSLAVFLSMLFMAFVWGLWATLAAFRHEQRVLESLPDFCCMVILHSSLAAAFNLVPGIWVTVIETNIKLAGEVGSHPGVFVSWLLLSYPVGLLFLSLELWVLEGIFFALEQATLGVSASIRSRLFSSSSNSWASGHVRAIQEAGGMRAWRGHWSRRWSAIVPAYHWGFVSYWSWTAVTMYLYDHHQGYVPPFTPLSVLGWLVGTLRLLLHFLRRPDPVKRRKAWVRKRARDVTNFLRLWPTRANRNLLRKWKRLRKDVVRHLDPTTLLRLLLNACCPGVWGLRARVARWTGFKLSSLPGCQVSLTDELDWSYAYFVFSSLTPVLPLIIYWLYQRFGDARVLSITPPYVTLRDKAPWVTLPTFNQEPTLNSTPPLLLIPTPNPSYIPMVYEEGVQPPFRRCHWDESGAAMDPGDFQICLESKWQDCLMQPDDCQFPRCQGLATSILAEPSRSLWFQMQLVCYAGFLLFVLWTIKLEREEKLYVSMAFRLNGIYRETHDRYRAVSHMAAKVVLVALGVLYGATLMLDHVEEDFVFFASAIIKRNAFYIDSRDSGDLLSNPAPLLMWFCEAMGNQVYTVRVKYKLSVSDAPVVALVQGAYFFYQLYGMHQSQQDVYEFVNPDLLLTAHLDSDAPAAECSYWTILQHRESGRVVERGDVDEVLHATVYMPFLRNVYLSRPDILFSLFNQCEINVLLTELEAAMEMQEPVLGGQSGKPGPEEEEEVKSDPAPEAEEDQALTGGPALSERQK